jgi:1-acyl-sn-glycerol-3-phosphate acyltransferase
MTVFCDTMNVLKNILGRIYLFYFLLLFIITMLPTYLFALMIRNQKEPKRSEALHKIFKAWMGVFMPMVFCPVRRKGTTHFENGKTYVVVCNHNSFMDIPVSSPWIPGANKTLAKIEISKVPLFGTIYKLGSILVDRKNEKSRKDSFVAMRQTIQMGVHLCLYPEGTRNKSDKHLQDFQDGAFVVAIREQVPIMPAVIFNTGKILPHNKVFFAWPSAIPFHFLAPISTKGLSLRDLPELKEHVWQIMNDYYQQNRQC